MVALVSAAEMYAYAQRSPPPISMWHALAIHIPGWAVFALATRPVDRRFADTLDRARTRLVSATAASDAARRLIAEVSEPRVEPGPEVLVATTGRRSVVIHIADIDWIEAQDYCALVHTRGASYLLRKSIRALEQQLAPRGFVRVHRSAIVNLARVCELRRPGQGEWAVVLECGTELPVSRRLRPLISRHMRS